MPIKDKITLDITFNQIDFWGRPIFNCPFNHSIIYLCAIDTIFPDKHIAPNNSIDEIEDYFMEHLDELVIFGSSLEDDPLGTKLNKRITLNIVKQ